MRVVLPAAGILCEPKSAAHLLVSFASRRSFKFQNGIVRSPNCITQRIRTAGLELPNSKTPSRRLRTVLSKMHVQNYIS